ncbi:MAG: GTPase, partial [Symploca sp. SIO3E6]|nr:GTPase [Caldora sp. SIO3E6]
MRLKLWQWLVLILPMAIIVGFLLIAAGAQIHAWGISWIWGVFIFLLLGWRWLLVKWTKPTIQQMEAVMAQVGEEIESTASKRTSLSEGSDTAHQIEAVLQETLKATQQDAPIWEDWQIFWVRCQELIVAIAQVYYPEVKYPLLNIYLPEAYGLLRGTVDDLDLWMQKLSPALSQVT